MICDLLGSEMEGYGGSSCWSGQSPVVACEGEVVAQVYLSREVLLLGAADEHLSCRYALSPWRWGCSRCRYFAS